MSANYVSDDLINYLLAAALHGARRTGEQNGRFCWNRHDGSPAELDPGNVRPTGQMLRDENVSSLEARQERSIQTDLPSTAFPTRTLTPLGQLRTGEILKAADYYEYQSSNHPGWWESDAREFLECLRALTWMTTPEYRRAQWGEPQHVRSYYRATPEPRGETPQGAPPGRAGLILDIGQAKHATAT